MARPSSLQKLPQRIHQLFILRRKADRDAQRVGKAVSRNGSSDDSPSKQLLVDGCRRAAQIYEDEVRVTVRDNQAHLAQLILQVAKAGPGDLARGAHVLDVVERRDTGGLGQRA